MTIDPRVRRAGVRAESKFPCAVEAVLTTLREGTKDPLSQAGRPEAHVV